MPARDAPKQDIGEATVTSKGQITYRTRCGRLSTSQPANGYVAPEADGSIDSRRASGAALSTSPSQRDSASARRASTSTS